MEKKYKYLGYILLLLIPLSFAGFYKTYFAQFPDRFDEHIGLLMHVHAFLAATWVLMLVVQPILILKKKNAAHKAVGKLSYIIFPLLVLSFIPHMTRIADSPDPRNLFFAAGDCTLLVIFYSLAIYHKRNIARHMRYMIAAALVLFGPTVGRIGPILLQWSAGFTQHFQYGLVYLVLISLIIYDRNNRKKYQPYLYAIFLFLAHQLTYYIVFR